jgi:hypothetical protein
MPKVVGRVWQWPKRPIQPQLTQIARGSETCQQTERSKSTTGKLMPVDELPRNASGGKKPQEYFFMRWIFGPAKRIAEKLQAIE